ncbi:unnamed protein product [Peniophora sp. CBMAI 1063]|nr:unnamed protein product [Peniophora sp. CBMAI 1063]
MPSSAMENDSSALLDIHIDTYRVRESWFPSIPSTGLLWQGPRTYHSVRRNSPPRRISNYLVVNPPSEGGSQSPRGTQLDGQHGWAPSSLSGLMVTNATRKGADDEISCPTRTTAPPAPLFSSTSIVLALHAICDEASSVPAAPAVSPSTGFGAVLDRSC